MSTGHNSGRTLICLFRRDLRVLDNPLLHSLSQSLEQSHKPYSHVLPLYVFPAQQIEVSGFVEGDGIKSPYPEARSQVGGFWRCGHHRASFLAQSVWDLKTALHDLKSDLSIRVGLMGPVVKHVVDGLKSASGCDAVDLWMTAEEGIEERREERNVRRVIETAGGNYKLWQDEKYFVDDRDLPLKDIKELPDVFTSFRKMVEPLREAPRPTLPLPKLLPPLPSTIPAQESPFVIPDNLGSLIQALHAPLNNSRGLDNAPSMPSTGATTASPFEGGSKAAHQRLHHLLTSGAMTSYKDTRNGMLGPDFSTKLSAWLALGCLTARQVHEYLIAFEDGSDDNLRGAGYGKGENKGTGWVRFELLWRDYFRLCTRKFGPRLFRASGFRADDSIHWKYDKEALRRWLEGTTGTGLVDASQRELFLTGYTSNRARQNVASYLSKHLNLDWRLGAEWYECCLIDYDVSSNWGNWQYTAGVGNDPREGGTGRKFNPIKQTGDYDKQGLYIKAWCEELRSLDSLDEIAQCWKVPESRRGQVGLAGWEGCEKPLVRIQYKFHGSKDARERSNRTGRAKAKGARNAMN